MSAKQYVVIDIGLNHKNNIIKIPMENVGIMYKKEFNTKKKHKGFYDIIQLTIYKYSGIIVNNIKIKGKKILQDLLVDNAYINIYVNVKTIKGWVSTPYVSNDPLDVDEFNVLQTIENNGVIKIKYENNARTYYYFGDFETLNKNSLLIYGQNFNIDLVKNYSQLNLVENPVDNRVFKFFKYTRKPKKSKIYKKLKN